MTSVERYGTDIEEAVKYALQDLRLSRDEVEVEVLEEPSRGFLGLGLGAKLAKVKVTQKRAEEPEKPADARPEKEERPVSQLRETRQEEELPAEETETESRTAAAADGEERPRSRERRNRKKSSKTRTRARKEEYYASDLELGIVNKNELEEVEDHPALSFIKEITEKMGLDLNVKARTGEDIVHLEIEGKDSGTVIGKRGATLDAIQYLTSLVVNKDSEKYIKVVVDAENYRSKRQKTLEALANRLASKVQKTRKFVKLEPMNPYERKVIHATLQKNPNVITRSEGEEPYRRVVIELKK